MKKILAVFLVIGTFILLAGSAWGDTYDYVDQTLVQAYNVNTPSNNYGAGDAQWRDVIGEIDVYKIYGVNFNLFDGVMHIFTNMSSTGDKTYNIGVGDLFFASGKSSTTWNYGINLLTGAIYSLSGSGEYKTSEQVIGDNPNDSNLVYGGRWNNGSSPYPSTSTAVVPTLITGGNNLGSTDVAWTQIGSLNNLPLYRIDIPLGSTLLDNSTLLDKLGSDFAFIWGSGQCANDAIEADVSMGGSGNVPIPGSILLMGSGLVGLGLTGFRRRKTVLS